LYDRRVARFLIIAEGERGSALAGALEREGHVVGVYGHERPLGEMLGALDHVAIVCWLTGEVSPVPFLAGAIDSSMRGFVCQSGDWAQAVSETAAHNSIPLVSVRADPHDGAAWEGEVETAIGELLMGR
ncbi:MAG: hypothetical protein ACRDJ3_05745, partial [Solirubrobacteraceae bacterium]